jgi:chitinase
MRLYGFDGLDIDWEYPGSADRGGVPADKANLSLFLKEARAAFDATAEKFTLSIAAPAGYYYLQNFDVGEIHNYVHWIGIMAYDLHGT